MFQVPPLDAVARAIADKEQRIEERMRALFNARTHGGDKAVEALAGGLQDDSVLLVHEIAYVMGQIGSMAAVPYLRDLLSDPTRDCMIRHEAAEALAALGHSASLPLLQSFLDDSSTPVRETCQLAVRSLQEKAAAAAGVAASVPTEDTNSLAFTRPAAEPSVYTTQDPVSKCNLTYKLLPTARLRETLLDPTVDLYVRYEAMFVLRDRMTPEADAALIEALRVDSTSALFRHELAFVLGQVQTPAAFEALAACLSNCSEHPMARHEAALALGSLGSADCVDVLRKFADDRERVVAESCLVALDNIREESRESKVLSIGA